MFWLLSMYFDIYLLFFVTDIFSYLSENKQFIIDLLINKMLTSTTKGRNNWLVILSKRIQCIFCLRFKALSFYQTKLVIIFVF